MMLIIFEKFKQCSEYNENCKKAYKKKCGRRYGYVLTTHLFIM